MEVGTQVGAYRVLHQIGEGGMGAVWLAEHVALGRRAAVKVLHSEYSTKPEIVTRFFNEARAATAINDPGIVQIFDFGQHTDGSAYIVMELLDGEPLAKRLERQRVFTISDALRILRQVASSLGAAHARGIVHRDLKPDNIFIVRDPEVPGGERAKILDFGIAKLAGNQVGVKTQTAAVMGTPTYMSPEQCRGAGQVDQRSDVYALGCVLFHLLTGRPPFDAEGVGEIIAMHLREPPVAPSFRAHGIPVEIDQLVLCCLAKDPGQRFPSAAELAAAIGALLVSATAQVPTLPRVSGGHAAAAVVATTLSAATGASMAPPAKRSRAPWIAGLVGVVAIGSAAIAIVASNGSGAEETPSIAPAPLAAASPPPTPAPKPAVVPGDQVAPSIKDALTRFVAWSKDHTGAPCPDAATLGAGADPWGHALRITCVDQPGDQIVGAISDGPDGATNTADDIASWQLGRDVTDLVHGPRWDVASKPAPAAASVVTIPRRKPAETKARDPKPEKSTEPKPAEPKPKKPAVEVDENGMPTSR